MKRFALIPLASLLLLAPALPAAAKHADRAERRVERHDVRICGTSVHDAAAVLERRTRRLLQHAREHVWHPNRAERRALRELAQLRREAREFRDTTEHTRRVRHVARDFRHVQQRFHDAARRFRALDPDRKLRKDFRKVALAMATLDEQLDHRAVYHGRPWARERYEVASHRHRH